MLQVVRDRRHVEVEWVEVTRGFLDELYGEIALLKAEVATLAVTAASTLAG